jgi:putative flippase GtrA
MNSFFKVQVASVLGSFADYLTTIILVAVFHIWYLIGNLLGNIAGGTAQFVLCRNWAFPQSKNKIENQAIRFVVVFAGNLILSAAGVYFCTEFFRWNYLLSKTVVSVLLGISYSYLMQKKFVFV